MPRITVRRNPKKRKAFTQKASSYPKRRKYGNTRKMSNYRTGGYLGIEFKYYDLGVTSATVASPASDCSGGEQDPATVNCLNAMAIGDEATERIGKQISMTHLQIAGTVERAENSNTAINLPPASGECTVVLLLDTQANGATFNSEDVYKNLVGNAEGNACLLRNLEYSKRFKVIKKRVFSLDYKSITAYDDSGTPKLDFAGVSVPFEWNIDLKGLKTDYKGSTAGIGNVLNNALHVMALATTTGFKLSYASRLRFVG